MNGSESPIFSVALVALLFQMPCSEYKYRYINPKGWNIPDIKRLVMKKSETMSYPNLPFAVNIKSYRYEGAQAYVIEQPLVRKGGSLDPSLFIKVEVEYLDVYTGPEDQILCYRLCGIGGELTEESKKKASKLPKSAVPISLYGGLISFITDLDSDGIYESMYDLVVRDLKEEELLITLIKTKLGIISKGQ